MNLYAYCGNDPVGHWDYLGTSWLSKLWRKFRHTIISTVIRVVGNAVLPGLGEVLSKVYNVAVGAHYGGARGGLMAFAGTGGLGDYGRMAAQYGGIYQQFRRGKFFNNLGDYFANAAIANATFYAATGQPGEIPRSLRALPGQIVHGIFEDWRAIGRTVRDMIGGRRILSASDQRGVSSVENSEPTLADSNAVIAVGDIHVRRRLLWWEWDGSGNYNVSDAVAAAQERLRKLGYTVHVDNAATGAEIEAYLKNVQVKAFVFIGHSTGDGVALGITGSDRVHVSPGQFIHIDSGSGRRTYPYGGHLNVCVLVGCGSANGDISGLTWRGVFDPDGARGMWFRGFADPKQSVDRALLELTRGTILPPTP